MRKFAKNAAEFQAALYALNTAITTKLKPEMTDWWIAYHIRNEYSDFFRAALPYMRTILEEKQIPQQDAKAIEIAMREINQKARGANASRTPKGLVSWFNKNLPKFQLLLAADQWPARNTTSDLIKVGNFSVHNTVGLSAEEFKFVSSIVEQASQLLSSKFASVLYGDVYVVGQLQDRNAAAWYEYKSDKVYIRLYDRSRALHDLLHELSHRYYRKFTDAHAQRAWQTYHMRLHARMPAMAVQLLRETDLKNETHLEFGDDVYIVKSQAESLLTLTKMKKSTGKTKEMIVDKSSFFTIVARYRATTALFTSQYASTNPEEHFCDSVADFVLNKLNQEQQEALTTIFNL